MEGTLFLLVTVTGFQESMGAPRLAPQIPLRLSAAALWTELLDILHLGHPEIVRRVTVRKEMEGKL